MFLVNCSEVIHETFAINAANFSISTLVLQKQHMFKHKRGFFQVKKIKRKKIMWYNMAKY